MDWCARRLVRMICSKIISTSSSPGSLLICRSLAICLRDLLPFAIRSSEVRRLLLDLDPYGGTDPFGMFPLFLMRNADVLRPPQVVSWLAGDRTIRQNNPLIRRVHRHPLFPITERFPYHQYCLWCLSVWCRFVSDD